MSKAVRKVYYVQLFHWYIVTYLTTDLLFELLIIANNENDHRTDARSRFCSYVLYVMLSKLILCSNYPCRILNYQLEI